MAFARHALQVSLFLALHAAVALVAISSRPSSVLLPGAWFYVAFLAVPCFASFLVARLAARRPQPIRFAVWLLALATGLVAFSVQMWGLLAYASSLSEVAVGGLLSNFYVTAHQAFHASLLVGAVLVLLLAASANHWVPSR